MSGAALARKEAGLRRELASMDGALVAFSGGVDSSVLLAMAAQELGYITNFQKMQKVTLIKPVDGFLLS